MKKTILLLAALLIALPAAARAAESTQSLQEDWAHIKYQVQGKEAKLSAIQKLEARASAFTKAMPGKADPLIWEAIILATEANISKSLSALPKLEKAKSLLEQSLKIDGKAMEGAAHMTLGSMYFQVPGWPVGFGDDDLAEQHLKIALKINPNGTSALTYYVTGTYYQDMGGERDAVFTSGGDTVDVGIDSIGSYGDISLGLSYLQSLSNGPAGARQLNAGAWVDTRFGENVSDSYSLTAQIRLSF